MERVRDMIKPIVVGLIRRKSLEDQQTNLNKGLQNLIDTMEKKWSKEEELAPTVRSSGVAKVVKLAKVPTWNKCMSLEVYMRKSTI